jgi:methionine synthase I (cobalamin-dependent)
MSRTAEPPHPWLRAALGQRVVVADGAVGSMPQGSAATLDDFAGHEGCNEILNITRPDIVRSIHDDYLSAAVDCISTNTFGANLGEYGIADRISELAEAGARQAADDWAKVARLLAPDRIGVGLPEEFQLAPEQSTDALIAHHPEAKYFSA